MLQISHLSALIFFFFKDKRKRVDLDLWNSPDSPLHPLSLIKNPETPLTPIHMVSNPRTRMVLDRDGWLPAKLCGL